MFKASLKDIDERNSLSRRFEESTVYGINLFAATGIPINYVMMNGERPKLRGEDDTVSEDNESASETLETMSS